MTRTLSIALVAEFREQSITHQATMAALQHAQRHLPVEIQWTWLSSSELSTLDPHTHHGFWFTTGAPHTHLSASLTLLSHTREHNIPTFGTCSGFQLIALSFARDILHLTQAQHAEYDPDATLHFITPSSCFTRGQPMTLTLTPNSRAALLYKKNTVQEQYYCSFAIHPEHEHLLRNRDDILIEGFDPQDQIRILSWNKGEHPFYLATLFVPQIQSTPEAPHPLVLGFLQSCLTSTDISY